MIRLGSEQLDRKLCCTLSPRFFSQSSFQAIAF